ncbi:MAG: hypothetical protein ACLSAP_07485 [Oscillospiraceae bacterium]
MLRPAAPRWADVFPAFAGAAMALSSVSVVLNSLRLTRFQAKLTAEESEKWPESPYPFRACYDVV